MEELMTDRMDLASIYLCEVQYFLENTEHDYFTEAEGGEDPAVVKSEGPMKAAANAIKAAIQALINKIRDFIDRIFMSKDERNAFNQFKEACKSDPELRTKKITVKNYRKTLAEYDAIEKELEAYAQKTVDANAVSKLTQKVTSFLGREVKVAAVPIVADTAVKMAMSNRDVANVLSAALQKDSIAMKQLEAEMGKKAANKLRKDVEACTHKFKIRQLLLRIRKGKFDCLEEAIDSQKQAISDIIKGKITKNNLSIATGVAAAEVRDKGVGGMIKTAKAVRGIQKDISKTQTTVNNAVADYKAGAGKGERVLTKSELKAKSKNEKAIKQDKAERDAYIKRRDDYRKRKAEAKEAKNKIKQESVTIMGIRD